MNLTNSSKQKTLILSLADLTIICAVSIIFNFLAFGLFSAPALAEWHQEAHDAQHTGYTPDDVSGNWTFKWQWNGSCSDGSDCRPGNPEQGWSFEIPPRSHPVTGGGRLYLPAGSHGVYAINESNGRTAWHNSNVDSYCTAAYDPESQTVFVASDDGRLYKLGSSDGNSSASFQADSGLNQAPIVVEGRVYVVSDNGTLYAIDKNTMSRAWSYSAGSPAQTPAAYSESYNTVVFGTADLHFHAVNVDGSLRWNRNVTPDQRNPGTDQRCGGPAYYFSHGWPVIAEQHGIVFATVRTPESLNASPPEGLSHYPTTNAEIRALLDRNSTYQAWFALRLEDGQQAFDTALPVPHGGSEKGAIGGYPCSKPDVIIGPKPVVRHIGGEEVVYAFWRSDDLGESGAHWNNEGGVCEMVLDNATVPGYQGGDCRYIHMPSHVGSGGAITVDETGTLSMAGSNIFYTHWIVQIPIQITNRSDSFGSTYGNAIQTQAKPVILNRIDGSSGCSQSNDNHYCSGNMSSFCDSKSYPAGFWVFWNSTDPPYQCAGAYSDGDKARYTIANNGVVYYELNGGSIFALAGQGGGSTPTPTPDPVCRYNLDGNGSIGVGDLLHILSHWDGSGITKLLAILANWGTSCS